MNPLYDHFLESPCRVQWQRVGTSRRAGVITPLFSVYSKKSIGVGEIPDLKLLADWCVRTGLGLIQLLPMNDVGMNFRPYDSESSFALEPMHLSLENITGVDLGEFSEDLAALRRQFNNQDMFFDTGIKQAKLILLKKMFISRPAWIKPALQTFSEANQFWLKPYTQYKVLKQKLGFSGWMDWPDEWKRRSEISLKRLESEDSEELLFHAWLQWQLFLQFTDAKQDAEKKGVRFIGDIPFLVSRDSADVWARPDYFKLDLSTGAPPDLYFADGQEWGMPPYHWENIARDDYRYVSEKLRYAENFYDLFRIDHFVGVFRVWTYPYGPPQEERKKAGAFDPPDESMWEDRGRKIVEAMIRSTHMLACAEDLGCVPDCSWKVLKEYAIPGMEVQRWMRHWDTTRDFKNTSEYRPCSIAVISTHDMVPLRLWWQNEAGSQEDKRQFLKHIGLGEEPADKVTREFLTASFRAIHATDSIFSIQLLQDWLSLTPWCDGETRKARINKPGTVDEKNWRLKMPVSLEKMLKLPENQQIRDLNRKMNR